MSDYQIHMFHFRCPTCGSSPPSVPLRDYLQEWCLSDQRRLISLLSIFRGAIGEVAQGECRWVTKKFQKAASELDEVLRLIECGPIRSESSLFPSGPTRLQFLTECPVCLLPPGERTIDNYFTSWPQACKVQTGNLLYETSLILWGILLGLPPWASGALLQQINAVRLEARNAGKAMGLMECPKCGRFSSCLFGENAEQDGYCRWCFDMGGGLGFGFSVSFDSHGLPVVEFTKTDYAAPARNAWDILPPEIRDRIGS